MNPVILNPSFETPPQPSLSYSAPPPPRNPGRQIRRAYQMHPVLAWVAAVLASLGLVAFALSRGPFYEATALIYVQPEKARVATDLTDGAYDSMRYDSYIEQQKQTLLRSDVLSEALAQAEKASGHPIWTLPKETPHTAMVRLQKNLKVERETGSYQLSVTLGGSDPKGLAALLNSIVRTYIMKQRLDELGQSDQQLALLMEERKRVQDELETDRAEEADLSKNLGVADVSSSSAMPGSNTQASNQFDTELAVLRSQLADARAARTTADAQLQSVQAASSEGPDRPLDAAAQQTLENDPGLAAVKGEINKRRSELATHMAGLTPKNPLYQQDASEIKRLDQSLDEMAGELRAKAATDVMDKLRLQASRARDVEARIERQLQDEIAIATGATTKLQRASFLSTNIVRLQARFTELDNAVNALQLEHGSTGLVHLLVPAETPLKPKLSKTSLILAAALPLGIVLGLMAAMLRQKMDPYVYIGEDVSGVLLFPPMAVLPAQPEVGDVGMEKFMLRLVGALDQAHSSGGVRSIVFSSVSRDTELSGLIGMLQRALEKLGYRVRTNKAAAILARGLAAPEHVVPELGGETKAALAGALHLESEGRGSGAQSSQHGSSGNGRSSLAAAPPSLNGEAHLVPAPVTAARGRRSVSLAEAFDGGVDLLLIEAPSLLFSAEAEFAARLADLTVLVSESAKTKRGELASALVLARRLSLKGVAAVLTEVRLRHADPELAAVIRQSREWQREEPARTMPEGRMEPGWRQDPLSIFSKEPAALPKDQRDQEDQSDTAEQETAHR